MIIPSSSGQQDFILNQLDRRSEASRFEVVADKSG
jgi:hypothetical protein